MTGPERSREQLATHDQIRELAEEIRRLTPGESAGYGTEISLQTGLTELPPAVAAHVPDPEPTSHGVHNSVCITRFLPNNVHPRQDGAVGIITFSRREEIAEAELFYDTNVNYTIRGNAVPFSMERRITSLECGPHILRARQQAEARTRADPLAAALEGLQRIAELRAGRAAARPLEKATRILDVTEAEAQQVIDLIKGLQPKS